MLLTLNLLYSYCFLLLPSSYIVLNFGYFHLHTCLHSSLLLLLLLPFLVRFAHLLYLSHLLHLPLDLIHRYLRTTKAIVTPANISNTIIVMISATSVIPEFLLKHSFICPSILKIPFFSILYIFIIIRLLVIWPISLKLYP